jgi:hypothetical protein
MNTVTSAASITDMTANIIVFRQVIDSRFATSEVDAIAF